MRIVALGPLPPPLGGTTVLFEDFCRNISALPVELVVIDTNDRRVFSGRWLSVVKTWWRLFASLRGADVITLHASSKRMVLYGAALRVISLFFRIPVVVRGFGGGLDVAYMRKPPFMRYLYNLCFSNSLILLETQHLISFFRDLYPNAKVDWLPNSRVQGENSAAESARSNRFVFAGHVNEKKGVGLIVRMLKKYSWAGLEVDVIGACGTDFDRAKLEGVPGLRYLGERAASEVRALMSGYRAVVLPTVYEGEGYPGVILEAYMAGLPVVATRWRSIPEIVEPGRTGFLIDPDNEDQLFEALRCLASDEFDADSARTCCIEYGKRFDSKFWHREKWREWFGRIGLREL